MKVERAERLNYHSGFPVFLSRYVLIADPPRRVALHFFNAGDVIITGLKYTVREKNEAGEEICVTSYEQRGLFAELGREFAVPDARVGKECVSVEASVTAVISDDYEYVVEGDSVSLRYGATSEQKQDEPTFLHNPKYKARRKRKQYVWVSILSVLAFAVIAVLLAWRLNVITMIERVKADNGTAETRTIAEYVETQ